MKINRRKFVQTLGAGAAGFELAATVPSVAAQAKKVAKERGTPLKMVVRADDVGYTNVCNIGAFEAIERGVVTSADVMLETPGAMDALERLKALPWISVGWHTHFWGSPVLDPSKVPSMVIKEAGRIRFRKDLRSAKDVVFEEALMECRAQMDRCVKILGRAPDTGGGGPGDSGSPFARALSQTCDEHGIVSGFAGQASFVDGVMKSSGASDKWASRKIYMLDVMAATAPSRTDSIKELGQYDPFRYYAEGGAHLKDWPEGSTVVMVMHPGWVDYFVYRLGDYGPAAWTTILTRVMDAEALCSDRMRNWIKENRIELINFRDALYGTSEYQNHLKLIGSDLAIG